MDLPEEAIRDTLEGLTGDLKVKSQNVAFLVQNLESLSVQIKDAESKMSHRRKVIENRALSIRNYIKQCMDIAGVSKIECPEFALTIKKNPPSVEIVDESKISDVYKRTPPPPEPVLDKKLILETLKGGHDVEGARLVQNTRLDIK
jgi:hypothetical protein